MSHRDLEDYSKPRKWTSEEENILVTSEVTDIELAHLLKRSLSAIHVKRAKLKKKGVYISPKKVIGQWKPEEEEMILTSKLSNEELSMLLGKTIHAIVSKRYKIKKKAGQKVIHSWTLKDEELFFNSDLTNNELAQKLGRTINAISSKRYRLKKNGIKKQSRRVSWTQEEENLLFSDLTDEELAQKLNRSFGSIRIKRKRIRADNDLIQATVQKKKDKIFILLGILLVLFGWIILRRNK